MCAFDFDLVTHASELGDYQKVGYKKCTNDIQTALQKGKDIHGSTQLAAYHERAPKPSPFTPGDFQN